MATHDDGLPGADARDLFAHQAMAIAAGDYAKGIPEYDLRAMFGGRIGLNKYEIIAAIAYRYADEMMKRRALIAKDPAP